MVLKEKVLEQMEKVTTTTDTHLLQVLQDCDSYMASKQSLIALIKDGIFQLSMARKNGQKYSIEYCRSDLEPTLTVVTSENAEITTTRNSITDPALLIAGLAPRGLRKAQSAFERAMEEVAVQARLARRITASLPGST